MHIFICKPQYVFYVCILAATFQLEGLKYVFGACPKIAKIVPKKKNAPL